MFCPNCGASLKDGAKFCTSCGQPVNVSAPEQPVPPQIPPQPQQTWQPQPQQPEQTWQPQPQQPEQTWQPQPQQPQWQQPQQQWQQPQQQWQQPQQQWQQPQQPIPPVKTVNKGKRLAAILIPVGAVALIAVLVAVFFQPISNFFRRTVSSPESYYRYVEKREAERLAEDAGDYYGAFVPEQKDVTDRSFEAELSLTLGDGARELLSEGADQDMSWFKDVSIRIAGALGEKLGNAELELALNGAKVISADGLLDFEGSALYAQVPLLSDRYFSVPLDELQDALPGGMDLGSLSLGDLDLDDITDMLGLDLELEQSISLQELVGALPSDREIRTLLDKYLALVSEQVENVEKSEQTIAVRDVSQKCTALTATIDEEGFKKIAAAVLTELKQDPDVKEIVMRLAAKIGEMAGEEDPDIAKTSYEEFTEQLQEALDELDDLAAGVDDILHVVYIDNSGEIVGRKLTGSDTQIEYLRPQDGERYALRLYLGSPDFGFTITGSGTERGGKLTGSYVIGSEEEEYGRLEIEDFEKDALKSGAFKGSFTFYPSPELMDDGDLPISIPNLGLRVDADCGKDDMNLSVAVLQNKDVYLGIALKLRLGHEKPSGKLPSSALDAEQWAETIDPEQALEEITNALKKAGAPEDLLNSLMGMMGSGIGGDFDVDFYD